MKRKLAWFTCAFAAGIVLALLILPIKFWVWCSLAFAFLALVIVLLSRRSSAESAAFLCIAVAASFLWCAVYYYIRLEPIAGFDDESYVIHGTVIEAPTSSEYGSSVMLRLHEGRLMPVKARLYAYGQDLSDIECGTEIAVAARVSSTLPVKNEGILSLSSRGCFLSARTSEKVEVLGKCDNWWYYYPGRFAKDLKDRIMQTFPDDASGFVIALLTGDTEWLRDDLIIEKALLHSGIYHICSVSGLHVMFLASMIAYICPSKKLAAVLTIVSVTFFAAITGFPASMIRAAFMLFASIVAPLIYREADSLTSLAGALLVILILNPWSLFSAGLQLSFAATLGIVVVSGRIINGVRPRFSKIQVYKSKYVKGLLDYILGSFGTSFGATVFTIPISAYWFGYFSLVAPITNLLVMPIVNLVFYFAGAACAVSVAFLPAAKILGGITAVGIRLICEIAKLLARSPVSVIYTSNGLVIIWLILVYLIIALLVIFKCGLKKAVVAATAAAAVFSIFSTATTQINSKDSLTVYVLDVGQGQCIVLRDSGLTAVIDCGSNSIYDAGAVAVSHLKDLGESCIDLMIFTHFDSDHTNGVDELFSAFEIGVLAIAEDGAADGDRRDEIVELADGFNSNIAVISSVSTVEFGSSVITVFPPVEYGVDNSGVVVLVSCGEFDVLVTGDIATADEKKLLSKYDLPDLEVLVVGHHGSYYSTSEILLDELTPDVAVVSVGENSYGHPNEDVLKRLSKRRIEIYRTDIDGTITLTS